MTARITTSGSLLQGPIYVYTQGLPAPVDLGQPGPSPEAVRAQAPWYLQDFEITDLETPAEEPAGVGGTASFTTTAAGLPAGAIKTTMTVPEALYTPTAADHASQEQDGRARKHVGWGRRGADE